MIAILFFIFSDLALPSDAFIETNWKRTENEWICTRCRRPAEGSYCSRCGQPYIRPQK